MCFIRQGADSALRSQVEQGSNAGPIIGDLLRELGPHTSPQWILASLHGMVDKII